MTPLILALALFMQDAPAADAPVASAPAAAPVQDAFPPGAPRDNYGFVAWCYGALRGYVDLQEEVMPEVTRIETTYRRPGSNLAADLKVYDDQMRIAKADLETFQAAITAAEKASARPIMAAGADAVRRGRSIWKSGPGVTKARMAQEWMSWTLPQRCQTTAKTLQQQALLAGPALAANLEPAAEPAAAPAPAEAAPPEAAPAVETPPAN